MGREGQREWERKVGVRWRKRKFLAEIRKQKVSRHPVFEIRFIYCRSFVKRHEAAQDKITTPIRFDMSSQG